MSDALGLPTSITISMIEGNVVSLRAILSSLINKRTYGVIDNMHKFFCLALFFVGKFCFALKGMVLRMLEP